MGVRARRPRSGLGASFTVREFVGCGSCAMLVGNDERHAQWHSGLGDLWPAPGCTFARLTDWRTSELRICPGCGSWCVGLRHRAWHHRLGTGLGLVPLLRPGIELGRRPDLMLCGDDGAIVVLGRRHQHDAMHLLVRPNPLVDLTSRPVLADGAGLHRGRP